MIEILSTVLVAALEIAGIVLILAGIFNFVCWILSLDVVEDALITLKNVFEKDKKE